MQQSLAGTPGNLFILPPSRTSDKSKTALLQRAAVFRPVHSPAARGEIQDLPLPLRFECDGGRNAPQPAAPIDTGRVRRVRDACRNAASNLGLWCCRTR